MRGELASLFGVLALPLDKWARTIGYYRLATETWKTISPEDQTNYLAFCAGVNDYVSSLTLLPPEFYIAGLQNNVPPWHPTDVLGLLACLNLGMTWDWGADLIREFHKMESDELKDFAEEIAPFHSQYLYNLVTVLDDDDLRRLDKWSD
jgi:penicillin amidase